MKTLLQFIAALAIAALCVAGFRALAFTPYTVEGSALAPELMQGDCIVVNRWSYGLRIGSHGGPLSYMRLMTKSIKKGDIVAFDNPADSLGGVCVCRCMAVPGDTISMDSDRYVIPGRKVTNACEDYYWMEHIGMGKSADSHAFGPVPESCIIGRVCMVLYSHDPNVPIYRGFRTERTCMRK